MDALDSVTDTISRIPLEHSEDSQFHLFLQLTNVSLSLAYCLLAWYVKWDTCKEEAIAVKFFTSFRQRFEVP